jgi:hypothetical protein
MTMRLRFPRITRYPTTPEGWLSTANELGEIAREVMAKAATEINADDLANEIRADTASVFPLDQYRRELNRRSRGTGDRAERLAGKELRRRRS